jgi:hypothetical protein
MNNFFSYSTLFAFSFGPMIVNFFDNYMFIALKIFMKKFKILSFVVNNNNKIKTIIGKIKNSSDIDDENLPLEYFYGYYYLGYIYQKENHGERVSSLWILTFQSVFDEISKSEIEKKSDENENSIKIWNRKGNYYQFGYFCRKLIVIKQPLTSQTVILNKIQNYYKTQLTKNCVVFIHGKSGSGKSTLAILLTHALKCNYCNAFNNTEPCDNLDGLYCRVEPTETSPLIILLDEVDVILYNISSDLKIYKQHESSPREVHDKRTWNSFLDKIDQGLYPNLIVIMTSNKSRVTIDSYDKSFIREGRVNLYFELE